MEKLGLRMQLVHALLPITTAVLAAMLLPLMSPRLTDPGVIIGCGALVFMASSILMTRGYMERPGYQEIAINGAAQAIAGAGLLMLVFGAANQHWFPTTIAVVLWVVSLVSGLFIGYVMWRETRTIAFAIWPTPLIGGVLFALVRLLPQKRAVE